MSAASNHAETLALTWLLTNSAATRPTAWYVGLHTADVTDAGSGTEVSGGSYAREAVTFSVTDDTASNTSTITFTTATANWGTISHIGIWDASSGGNLLFHGAVTASKTIETGDSFQITSGSLTITLA